MNDSIIIIGAGAAGLMAAKELSVKGYRVTILEANNRLGGRIWTINNDSFLQPVEAGAEFVHGNLKLTQQLLKEANIAYYVAGGKMLHYENGEAKKQDDFTEGWDELMEKMHQLKADITVAEFLNKSFSGDKYESLRQSVQAFAEGFDLADIDKASVFALRDEWSHEDGKQYRVEGGYHGLINYLAETCKKNGCIIETSCTVREVHWKKNEVKICTPTRKDFVSNKVIVTVPVSALQSKLNAEAAITFTPSIHEILHAAKMIGYGTVTKILLQFNEVFWNKDVGFILSNEPVPTWWTQSPQSYPLLTGWLREARMKKLENTDTASILEGSLQSLASIFKINVRKLKQKLTASSVIDWSKEPFALGGYSYNMIGSSTARKIMNMPIQQTIFFAGEALYEGRDVGTVEAALVSGRDAAEKVMHVQ